MPEVEFHFIYEHPFIAELDAIEPNFIKQTDLTMQIENACARQIVGGMAGYGFARVSWTRDLLARDLLAWYQTSGTVVYLLSVKYDLIVVPKAA
jgi:hypothetical protein